MENLEIDAYSPAQMAARVEKIGIAKSHLDFLSTMVLSMLAGTFIAFGAAFYTYVVQDSTLSPTLSRLLGGLVFCLGLILVIVGGAELFTGNSLLVMACVSRKITLELLLRNWAVVFVGNLIGALGIMFLVSASGQWTGAGAAVGAKALMIANGKVNLTLWEALSRGILCNTLVCLAVWLCFSGRSVTDKILAILFPITAFVALGFEHSIANMYFIPAGLLVKHDPQVLAAAQAALGKAPDLSNLTMSGFLLHNLVPVTIGNMLGGGVFVGAVYWFVYLRGVAVEPVRRFMTASPISATHATTVTEAVALMKQHNSGSVMVGEFGQSVGIVTEADIVRKGLAAGANLDSVTLDKIMSAPLITVDIKTPIYEVYRTMANRGIRHLIITQGGRQIGFVSVKDLLRKPIV